LVVQDVGSVKLLAIEERQSPYREAGKKVKAHEPSKSGHDNLEVSLSTDH
jgi:hypothetical protein